VIARVHPGESIHSREGGRAATGAVFECLVAKAKSTLGRPGTSAGAAFSLLEGVSQSDDGVRMFGLERTIALPASEQVVPTAVPKP
jgi:hypothetical protein